MDRDEEWTERDRESYGNGNSGGYISQQEPTETDRGVLSFFIQNCRSQLCELTITVSFLYVAEPKRRKTDAMIVTSKVSSLNQVKAAGLDF